MKKSNIAVAIISSLICLNVSAENQFSKLDQVTTKLNQPNEARHQEFYDYLNNYLDEYEAWRDEYIHQIDTKKAKLISQWGVGLLSDKSVDVEYSQDNTVRTVVDYESNTATVSVIIDEDQTTSDALDKLGKKIINVDGSAINIEPESANIESIQYSVENERKEKLFIVNQTKAQMNDIDVRAERLIRTSTGIPDSFIYQRAHTQKTELLKQAQERINAIKVLYTKMQAKKNIIVPEISIASTATPELPTEPVNKTKPATPNKVVSYKVHLPKNSLKARAAQFKPLAEKEAQTWAIDPALVMAIMHSESSFKPSAKSHIPAYGLMQIVPSSAGHDVNKQIRNIDAPMNSEDLYIPEINVETGTAYLNILNSKYLKKIKDDKSRLYCVIAAYNTGAGNVAKAFNRNRSTSIKSAAKIINSMSSEQVYNQLMNNLPYDETKNYLKKVSSRIALYQPATI